VPVWRSHRARACEGELSDEEFAEADAWAQDAAARDRRSRRRPGTSARCVGALDRAHDVVSALCSLQSFADDIARSSRMLRRSQAPRPDDAPARHHPRSTPPPRLGDLVHAEVTQALRAADVGGARRGRAGLAALSRRAPEVPRCVAASESSADMAARRVAPDRRQRCARILRA
jgi:hypothetical protein